MPVNWKAAGGILAAAIVLILIFVTSRDTGTSALSNQEIIEQGKGAVADPYEVAAELMGSEVTDAEAATPAGYVPRDPDIPGMDPEWLAYAQTVDSICSISTNAAESRAKQIDLILIGIQRLGPPPEKGVIFDNWRDSIKELRVIDPQDTRAYRKVHDRSNKIGRRFGLRVCTQSRVPG